MKMCIIVFETPKKKSSESKQRFFFFLPPVKSLCGITQSLLGFILCDVGNRTRAIMQ